MVSTSKRWGTFLIKEGESANKVAAKMGKAAFLAPPICTSPCKGFEPRITNLLNCSLFPPLV